MNIEGKNVEQGVGAELTPFQEVYNENRALDERISALVMSIRQKKENIDEQPEVIDRALAEFGHLAELKEEALKRLRALEEELLVDNEIEKLGENEIEEV